MRCTRTAEEISMVDAIGSPSNVVRAFLAAMVKKG